MEQLDEVLGDDVWLCVFVFLTKCKFSWFCTYGLMYHVDLNHNVFSFIYVYSFYKPGERRITCEFSSPVETIRHQGHQAMSLVNLLI